MAKHKPAKAAPAVKSSINLEENKYFVPIVFLLLFLALVVMFSDFIFSDKMLHSSDTIQAGIFFRSMLVDAVWENGAVPQWNPYIFGGMPYVEAFHGDIFYPLSLLKYFGSIFRSLGYVLFFHIFLAGLFMFFTARAFNLNRMSSLIAAVAYMFSSYLISLVSPGHDGKMFVTTLFPLTILFLKRGFESADWLKAVFNFTLLGLTIGVIILSPHPQMSYYSLWAISFFAAFFIISDFVKTKNIVKQVRPAVLTAYAVVIGLLFSAIQFYPGYLYTNEFSPRGDAKQGWEWATSWSLHEEEAFSQLIPEFSGVSVNHKDYARSTYYWGKNYFKDNSETIGVIPIFLALLGFFFYRRKESYFLGGLALFALVYGLGATTPIFKIFFHLIPKVQSLRAPSMIMFLFSFSIAMLAGMGVQKIIESARSFDPKTNKRFQIFLFGFPGLLLLLALWFNGAGKSALQTWSSLFYGDAPRTMVQQGVSKLDVAYLNLPAIQSGAWFSFIFVLLAALAIWLYQSKKAGVVVLSGLLLLPVINSVRFNKRFVTTYDQKQEFSPNALTNFFTSKTDKYRVMNFTSSILREDFLPHFGVEVVVGYHGNQLKWYDQLLGSIPKANQGNPNFQNLVGAKYLLVPAQQNFPPGYFGDKPVSPVANFGQITILENQNAFPRAYLADKFEVVNDFDRMIQTVLDTANDIRNIVYLEEPPTQTYTPDTLSSDSAWITSYGFHEINIGTSVTTNKLLVLTDNYYDAWHVTVDGSPGKVMRAYGSFRAVELPAGTQEVVFHYESERYATGKLLTLLSGIFMLIVIGGYGVMRYRKPKESIIE